MAGCMGGSAGGGLVGGDVRGTQGVRFGLRGRLCWQCRWRGEGRATQGKGGVRRVAKWQWCGGKGSDTSSCGKSGDLSGCGAVWAGHGIGVAACTHPRWWWCRGVVYSYRAKGRCREQASTLHTHGTTSARSLHTSPRPPAPAHQPRKTPRPLHYAGPRRGCHRPLPPVHHGRSQVGHHRL